MDYNELKEEMRKQKTGYSHGERVKRYFSGEVVDYLPYVLLAPYPALSEVFGYTTSQMDSDFNIYQKIIEGSRDEFGVSGVNVRLSLRSMGAAMGSTLSIPEHGIDSIKHHILQDYSDWDKLVEIDPYNNKILTPMLETAEKLRKEYPDMVLSTGVVGPVSTAVAVRPIEKILRDTRKNPDQLKKLIALCVDNSLKWVEVFTKEFGGAQASCSDPVTCTDIFSEDQFLEFSLPEMKRLFSGLKEITGSAPSLHICGHTKGIWKYFPEMEISSFSVDNCEDLEELRLAIGDDLVISGNVPPVEVLRFGSIDDVINSVKESIRKGSTSPKGFILSSGCQIPIGTPRENLEAMIYAVRKYGRDAKIGEMPKGMEEA
ncbi:uroporphyrinogen decarboxylase family protein [Microaceticoccus formicicus]|uniref:uroporphyrinogen decarboxylase family protein n=1 Tax=Microaceticoccus formicicus TaxID=3118105 RepID=UPI003CD004AA|nr:uroporphyrinogen decarboxylase family protein [Peptoniphilaceae bacterium AMB_02]